MGSNLQNFLIIVAGFAVIVLIGLGAARLLLGTTDLQTNESPPPAAPSAEPEVAAVPSERPAAAPLAAASAAATSEGGDRERDAPSSDPSRIARSTVFLLFQGADGEEVIRGSGFVVGPGIVVTSYQLVSGTRLDPVSREGETRRSPDAIVRSGGSEPYYPADVLLADLGWDVAFLWVPDLDAPALDLASGGLPAAGMPIVAPAPPRGLEAVFTAGHVIGTSEVSGFHVLDLDVPITQALRGAPVVDATGYAVGMAIQRPSDKKSAGQAFSSVDLARLLPMARNNIPKK